VTDFSQTSCYRDTYLVLINLEKPELELNILQEPATITLCDTSDYFEFEIYNAKTGYAYELFGSVKLPDGLNLVPGTSQLFYPATGVWVDITDPELLPGNLYRWNVSENQAFIQANGLPGEDLSPQNLVRIRFRTLAVCGFVANTQNIYGAYAKEACGRSTNILNKPGERINILGLSPTYGVVPSLQIVGNQASVCGGEQTFNAQINLLGTPSVGDSALVILPQGATLVPGSYVPGLNAPAGPPTLTPSGFRLPLPLLNGGGNLQFRFKIAFGPGSGCLDQIISLQTRVRTEAFCQSLGIACEVYVSTGEYNLTLQVEHPELSIGEANINLNGTQPNISLNINNIGAYVANGVTAQVWQDIDGNQLVSPGDVLLQTLQSDQNLNPGGSLLLSDTLSVNGPWCGLLIVLPADENCTCSEVLLPIESVTIEHQTLIFCSLDPIDIGVDSLSGFQYLWQSSTGIACTSCATTTFTPNPGIPAGEMQTLVLEETSANCRVSHRFTLQFGALATINLNNAVICSGQAATLTANLANATYLWQGPGINAPGNQVQTVHPGADAVYALTVTFANGCTATSSASIMVLPSDTITLLEIQACEGSIVDVFGTPMTVENGLFQLSLTKSNGCDSTIFQPVSVLSKPLTEESLTFCAGDTLVLFGNLPITTSTQICRMFPALNGCDSTHCINTTAVPPPVLPQQDTIFAPFGQPIALGALSGYALYTWIPEPNPPCFNCPSIQVTPDTAGYTSYLLTVADENGCVDSLVWRVFVFPPCDPLTVKIPNAFTPNDDGSNDVFRPVASEGGELIGRMTIFDRWGEIVYENNIDASWDGTVKGKPGASDVYVYIIEVLCSDEMKKRVGEVTLLR